MRYGYCHPMLVEGDRAFGERVRRALENAGVPRAQTRMLHDADQAIAALKRRSDSVSFLLLDQAPAARGGLDVLRWIRGERDLAALPVFMLSGSGLPEHIVSAFELKVQSYFVKPADPSELQAIIEGILAYWYRRSHGSGAQ